ncbi:uncharacterized protein LOC124644470 [Helicoverpa zea]|uniref:uncharacterized protein LOC124644470 n=1 Tax=Helicoverpa zea TaxID=7113 RepID=UPI001F5772ED|nr:uncharacterized protein LOC124644470 [Helicoverpa zea]
MQHPKNESKIPIPPNVLKNFNVYDILEPQKNTAKTSDGAKVDKLIDIDDCSKDSGVASLDLNASFFDKNRDYDLVDLFQNIFVTPQHIKQKDTDSNENDGASSVLGSDYVEHPPGFDRFLDMLESGEKIDWTNLGQDKTETISDLKHDFIEETPRVLVPKVFDEPVKDPDELVREVLTQKTLEKLGSSVTTRQLPKLQSDSPQKLGSTIHAPALKSDSPKKNKSVPLTEITTDFSRFNLNNTFNNSKFESGSNEVISEVTTDFSRYNLNNSFTNSKFEYGSNEVTPRPEPKTSPVDSQISNPLTRFTVKAIQKDEKVYKKKRQQKPDHLKATYTKGPDFYEKSVVLPQIMARLTARLDYLEEIANQKKRLILDGGSTNAECTASTREEEKKKASYSDPPLNVQTKILNKPSTSGISSLKTPVVKDPGLCNIRRTFTAEKVLGASSTSSHSTQKPSTPENREFGKLSPIVLMEDCNKERLKAFKQSQRFIEFVLDGKHKP